MSLSLLSGDSFVLKVCDFAEGQGAAVYLVITKKTDHSCDATSLDLLITN